MINKTNISE